MKINKSRQYGKDNTLQSKRKKRKNKPNPKRRTNKKSKGYLIHGFGGMNNQRIEQSNNNKIKACNFQNICQFKTSSCWFLSVFILISKVNKLYKIMPKEIQDYIDELYSCNMRVSGTRPINATNNHWQTRVIEDTCSIRNLPPLLESVARNHYDSYCAMLPESSRPRDFNSLCLRGDNGSNSILFLTHILDLLETDNPVYNMGVIININPTEEINPNDLIHRINTPRRIVHSIINIAHLELTPRLRITDSNSLDFLKQLAIKYKQLKGGMIRIIQKTYGHIFSFTVCRDEIIPKILYCNTWQEDFQCKEDLKDTLTLRVGQRLPTGENIILCSSIYLII